MTKIVFDVNRSLKECPPDYYPDGVRFIKRIVKRRDTINSDPTLQARANVYELDNQASIKGSYVTHGFLYTERPQVISLGSVKGLEHDLVDGFNRDTVQDDLGWETAIYDVVEFDTPLRKRSYKYVANHEYAPSASNTDKDLLKGLELAVKFGELDRKDNKGITDYILVVAADKTKEYRKDLFKKFRKRVSEHATMRPLDTKKANELDAELEIPHQGAKNPYDKIGYVLKKFSPGNWWNGMEHLTKDKTQHKEVLIYGFIESPAPNTLKADREEFVKNFNRMKLGVEKCLGHYGAELNGNFPFKFIGFLPQDITETPKHEGGKKEIGIVDVDGDPVSKNY